MIRARELWWMCLETEATFQRDTPCKTACVCLEGIYVQKLRSGQRYAMREKTTVHDAKMETAMRKRIYADASRDEWFELEEAGTSAAYDVLEVREMQIEEDRLAFEIGRAHV